MTPAQKKEEEKKKLSAGIETGEEDIDEEEEEVEVKPKGGKKIEVDADDLRELIKSNKELKEKVDRLDSNAVATSPNIQVRRKQRDFDYTVRKWDNKIVLGLENMGTEKRPLFVYDVYDSVSRKNVQFINLILKGEKETVKKIDYITFLRDAEKVKARMISKEEREDVKEYGMIPKREMAENGYGMYETMVMIPVEVVSKSYEITLKLPEDEGGDEITVSSQWLNM